jgi:GT2 family glycosyltransferase
MNNVIYGMLKILKETPKVGTVGCRLHFEDNTIQHDGVLIMIGNNKQIHLTHKHLNCYNTISLGVNKVFGNTGGLMMMRKFVFEKCGFFNENYGTCFEDVELNARCLLLGLENYCDSNLVAYHYESQTRGKNEVNQKGEFKDYTTILLPFLIKNINFISNKIQIYKK